MLIQVKSSVAGGSDHLKKTADHSSGVIPVVVGRPQNITTPRDLAMQLDILDTDFIYPRSWQGEGSAFNEFKALSEQAIDRGRQRSQQNPAWFSAFVGRDPAAEQRFVDKMRRNLQTPPQ